MSPARIIFAEPGCPGSHWQITRKKSPEGRTFGIQNERSMKQIFGILALVISIPVLAQPTVREQFETLPRTPT
jgi:hypothetical protein